MSEQKRDLKEHQDRTIVTLSGSGKKNRDLKDGDVIGESYRLKELIGQGGMGYVFRAEHILMGKDYALKILAPDQINESNWQRFQSEGKAIAKLDHINIVKIYNMGVDQGEYPFYAMDLLEGPTLADYISSAKIKKMSENDILDIFIQLAGGFGYAHSRSIIHRDVKPGNVILISGSGNLPTAKIVDFGIAKSIGAQDLHKQSQTATGEVFGSPYYMSPEQCMGRSIDQRSDIYSLGCTFFEVFTGRPPFVGENALATAMMHQNDAAPTLKDFTGKDFSGKNWNDDLEALIARMLAKRPAERYQTMEQVRHDLERIREKKSLGKNARTGFDPRQKENHHDHTDTSHDDEGHSPPRKLAIALAAISILGVVLATYAYFVMQPFKAPTVHTLAPHDNLDTQRDIDAHAATTQAKTTAAAKKLATVGPITCTIDKKAGVKIFHCPQTSVGFLSWFSGSRDFNFDTDSHNDGRKVARGDVVVPLKAEVYLAVNHKENKDVLSYPDVLKSFGPSDLVGLRIESDTGLDLYGSQKEQDDHAVQVTNLIKATAGWKNFRYVYLYNCPVTKQAFDALAIHPQLNQLIAHTNEINGSVLTAEPYLNRLKVLDLMVLRDGDNVLSGFKKSSPLVMLTIKGHVTASGMQNLANCSKLQYLEVIDRSIDVDALEAMGKLKNLDTLDIRHCNLKPKFLPVLSHMKCARIIKLNAENWSLLEQNTLSRAVPSVRWTTKDPVTGLTIETR